METNVQPKYLLRFEAYQKSPLMLASWKDSWSEAVNQASEILDVLPFDKCEIWNVDFLSIVAIVEKKVK